MWRNAFKREAKIKIFLAIWFVCRNYTDMGSKPVPLPPVDDPYLPQQPGDQPSLPQQNADQPYPPQQPVVQPYPSQQPADQHLPPPEYQAGYLGVATVIAQQPAAYQQTSNTTIVVNQPPVVEQKFRDWSSGLCGCFEDCGSCKYVAQTTQEIVMSCEQGRMLFIFFSEGKRQRESA